MLSFVSDLLMHSFEFVLKQKSDILIKVK